MGRPLPERVVAPYCLHNLYTFMSSYIDPASSAKVVEIVGLSNKPANTYAPSYSAPNFTQAVDVRLFTRALIIVVVEGLGTGATLDIKLQQSAGDDFSSWTDTVKPDGSAAVIPQFDPTSDNTTYTISVDLSRTQNALGIHAVIASSGGTRARWGAYAVLFPYDTTNATEPDMEV